MLGTLNLGAFFSPIFLAAQELPGGGVTMLGAVQPIVIAFLAVAIPQECLGVWRVGWGCLTEFWMLGSSFWVPDGVLGVGLVVLGPAAELSPVGVLVGAVVLRRRRVRFAWSRRGRALAVEAAGPVVCIRALVRLAGESQLSTRRVRGAGGIGLPVTSSAHPLTCGDGPFSEWSLRAAEWREEIRAISTKGMDLLLPFD